MTSVLKLAGWALLVVVVLAIVGVVTMTRADIPYATLQAQYGDASDRYLDLPSGVHLHYRDQGPPSGEPIVLVHGFAASLYDWQDWVARLSGHYRVISLDLPGHGLTEAPKGYRPQMNDMVGVVDALTDKLGVKRFVLVGNSMGGGVAWHYALKHQDKLDGLVLVDSVYPPDLPGHKSRQKNKVMVFNLVKVPVLRGLLTHVDLTPLVRQGLDTAFVNHSLVTSALVRRYSDFSRAPGHRAILLSLQDHEPEDGAAVNAALGRLTVPTLVMHGRDDMLIPWFGGERTAKAIPGSTFIVYPGVGHVPMEQIPDKSAADLEAWITTKSLAAKKAG